MPKAKTTFQCDFIHCWKTVMLSVDCAGWMEKQPCFKIPDSSMESDGKGKAKTKTLVRGHYIYIELPYK